MQSEGLPKGPGGLLKGSRSLIEGPEDLSEGPRGLSEGPEGLPGGPGGGGANVCMDGQTEFLPIPQDFLPCRGRCPKTHSVKEIHRRQKSPCSTRIYDVVVVVVIAPTADESPPLRGG